MSSDQTTAPSPWLHSPLVQIHTMTHDTTNAVAFKSVLDLTQAEILKIRDRLSGQFPFNHYFEVALTANDPTRQIMVTSCGIAQKIHFDTLTVISVLGDLPEAAWRTLPETVTPLELHIAPDKLPRLKAVADLTSAQIGTQVVLVHRGALPHACHSCRRALPDDLEALSAMYGTHYPQAVFSHWMLALPFFVDEDNGAIVAGAGVLGLERTQSTACLGNFLVIPSHRGQGFGQRVGAALIRHMVEIEGIETLFLATTRENGAAVRLYEKLGFETVSEALEIILTPSGTDGL